MLNYRNYQNPLETIQSYFDELQLTTRERQEINSVIDTIKSQLDNKDNRIKRLEDELNDVVVVGQNGIDCLHEMLQKSESENKEKIGRIIELEAEIAELKEPNTIKMYFDTSQLNEMSTAFVEKIESLFELHLNKPITATSFESQSNK